MPIRVPAARFVVAAVVCWLIAQPQAIGQIPPYGGAREYVADLAARRARVMEALGPDSILILWAAPPRVYSTDVNYEYRQDSNFLYLTGLNEEGGVLVLVPGSRIRREFLFAPQGSSIQELWTGHVPTAAELTSETGIANVHLQKSTEAFDAFLAGLLSGKGYGATTDPPSTEFAAFFKAIEAGRARFGVLDRIVAGKPGEAQPAVPPPGSAAARGAEIQRRYPQLSLFNATEIVTRLRQIKTPYEQRVLRRSVEISAEAHIEGMKATRPGRWEYEVEAAIEYWYLKNGALSWGYPSIVGSGPNATTLHYLKSTRQMRSGDLLLVDAAANFQGLTGDITRTYPVTGRFSPEQRTIYELVLRAQEAGRAAATPGARAQAVNAAIRDVFADGLEELGLVVPGSGLPVSAQVSLWFPHGPVHGIGVDVHDPLGPLDPGAAFVIEPGLYIRPDRLETITKSPENQSVIDKLTPAVAKYRDIGVRIEDSFLMTSNGPESLSDKAPRSIRDVERVVGTGR